MRGLLRREVELRGRAAIEVELRLRVRVRLRLRLLFTLRGRVSPIKGGRFSRTVCGGEVLVGIGDVLVGIGGVYFKELGGYSRPFAVEFVRVD